MDEILILARPADGAPVVLNATAALVWEALADWSSLDELHQFLDLAYPTIAPNQRSEALMQILTSLRADELLRLR